MAAASDKARFYLEQYVPELQEYDRKQIFTRDEISAITAKRSDFEHTLNARRSQPEDYLKYIEYETNLDRLRKKRCVRSGVKATTFSGQRTVFFIFDRATKKFPGTIELWVRYIEFCKKEKANKKLARVFTSVLRLHPINWSLWILAAKYYAETQGDMATARSYMQRALRFCQDELKLYIEYAKLEMVYLAKLTARRKILGLDETREEKQDEGEDMIALPTITAEDIDPEARKGVEEVNAEALQRLAAAPAYTGAIPTAIFDAATKRLKPASNVAETFFRLVATFNTVPAARTILEHILNSMDAHCSDAAATVICHSRFHLFAVPVEGADFPSALGKALATLRRGMNDLPVERHATLAEMTVQMLLPYVRQPDELDQDLVTVLQSTIGKNIRIATQSPAMTGSKSGTQWSSVLEKLRVDGQDADAANLEKIVANAGPG